MSDYFGWLICFHFNISNKFRFLIPFKITETKRWYLGFSSYPWVKPRTKWCHSGELRCNNNILILDNFITPINTIKVCAPIDPDHKFRNKILENWLLMQIDLISPNWEPTVITTTPYSINVGRSLKVWCNYSYSLGITLETFHFPETIQMFLNPSPITQSSIKPQ